MFYSVIYIVEVVPDYDHPSPNLSSDNETSSSFSKLLWHNIYNFIILIVNNTVRPVIIETNDDVSLINNTASYQGESVKSMDDFNSEVVSGPCQILSYMIEEESDHIDEPAVYDNSTADLVCATPQFNDNSLNKQTNNDMAYDENGRR